MVLPNRTKIVATLGPASRSDKQVEQMVRSGANVFRLNAAHADHATIVSDIRTVRGVAKRLRTSVGILVDLQGPKIRVGPLENAEPVWLRRGTHLTISTAPGVVGHAARRGEAVRLGTSYRGLAKDVATGERILLDDGYIELRVLEVAQDEIRARVVHGGLLKQYKGINLPGSQVSAASLSAKDRRDLKCALGAGADFIALSFVRAAEDVKRLKRLIRNASSEALVVAKIERPEAVSNLTEIISAADALMIARGDMGVELGPAAVPAVQKRIIQLAGEARKPVITATQMLESMITNPRPTRAEASDVANAIYDGTSAVMLSAETASGKYPIRVVRTMNQIVRRTETDMYRNWEYHRRRRRSARTSSVTEATVKAAAYAALEVEAKVMAVFTESGATAQLAAGERTPTRIVAFTPFQHIVQRLSLTWGVAAFRCSRTRTSHEMTLEGEQILQERKLAATGDHIAVVFGASRTKGMTNILNIRVLG
ncbi:MAG: pyruvate kinase [Planctomycetota bacterium]